MAIKVMSWFYYPTDARIPESFYYLEGFIILRT